MMNLQFLCSGCGATKKSNAICPSCGFDRVSSHQNQASWTRFIDANSMVEETPQAGVLSEPEMNLDHTIDTLEQCYPDLPEKPQESRAMKSFLWTTTVVLWFGMIVLGLVAAFFVGVVGIAIYRAM